MEALVSKVDVLYDDCYIKKCELLCNDIVSKFDENIIVKQAVTTQTPHSLYFRLGKLIFSRKDDIGNKKYLGYAAHKHFNNIVKTFIIGKMSIECYYLYKSFDCHYIEAIDHKVYANTIKDHMNNEADTIKYDITLLTRKRTADTIISPVIKGTSMYWIKNAWEHLDDSSESSSIAAAFAREVSFISKAFDYYEKLACEMIELFPKMASIRCHLAKRCYESSLHDKAFEVFEKAVNDIPNNSTLLSDVMLYYAESLGLPQRTWPNRKYSRKQRAERALEYGKKLMELESQGKYVGKTNFGSFANLLCNWSKDFENSRDEQKLALSMFEKSIKMDQSLGWDVINNWTRDYIKFEVGLKDIIVRYWYSARVNTHTLIYILDCADLIETYFNDNQEKMKQAKILSECVPLESNVSMYMKTDRKARKKAKYFVSIRKPAKCDKQMIISYKNLNFNDYGVVLAWWFMDRGGAIRTRHIAPTNNANGIKIEHRYIAKLAYFFALRYDSNELLNTIGVPLNVKKDFRVLIVRLIVHYCWKLCKHGHNNFVMMIHDSRLMTRMVNNFVNTVSIPAYNHGTNTQNTWLNKSGEICDNIQNIVDLNAADCILRVADIVEPKIVFEKGDYQRYGCINCMFCLFLGGKNL